jgi:glycosyltransferase involved in cell wall biosynthesis
VNLYADMPIVRSWLRFAFGGADAVVAVSSALKDRILSLGIPGEKVFVVPNGVDREKFHPASREEARERTGLPRDRQVILSVGNLVPAKGFHRLLSAFAEVARDRKDIVLAIVGEGPDRKALESACGEFGLSGRVLFPGRVPHEDMVHWYNAADLFCLASEREGWPNVVQEALACGTPVVATPVGGIREILGDNGVGLLARDLGVGELARCLAQALSMTWDRGEVARTGGARSWREVSSDLQEIFRMATRMTA